MPSKSKITEFKLKILIHKYIMTFNIPMDNPMRIQIAKDPQQLLNQVPPILLTQNSLPFM
jgi:hypothetical protein